MNERDNLKKWDQLVTALENGVAKLSDEEVLALPSAGARAAKFRSIVNAALKAAGRDVEVAKRIGGIPTDPVARRELLRQVLARSTISAHASTPQLSTADTLTDAQVEEMLLDLLSKGLVK